MALRAWKWRRKANKGKPYYLKLHRNYVDKRFDIVYHLLAYLHYFELTKGAVFQKHDGNNMTPEQWEARTDTIFKQAGLYVPAHRDEDGIYHRKKGCTNHSIRRSAAQWAGRCGGREIDVRNTGRWKTMEELAKYMAQGAVDKTTAQRAVKGDDPVRTIWWWQPTAIPGLDGRDQM